MLHNGGIESLSPRPRIHQIHPNDTPVFQSTVPQRNLGRFHYIILIFRISAFSFSLSGAVIMLTTNTTAGSEAPRWYNLGAFGTLLLQIRSWPFIHCSKLWHLFGKFLVAIFPELNQVWFDFGHGQVFALLVAIGRISWDGAGQTTKKSFHVYG